ncbi:hypothetical protein ACHWQZ_G015337 [Mnemiopsis leidyi]
MMIVLILISAGVSATLSDGRIAVQRDVYINYDLENFPLQLKTDSLVGNGDMVNVRLYSPQGESAGGVFFYFHASPQYYLNHCNISWTNFPTALPSEKDKVWTITLSRISGEIRVVVNCNDIEVLNVVLSSSTCTDNTWRTYWSRDVDKIYFHPTADKASDYYRPAPQSCTGLKTEWTSTIKTSTQFPVDPGTVVEVTCSNPDAVNEGSSEVTCTGATDYAFSIEPSCSIPALTSTDTTPSLHSSPLADDD